MQLQLNPNIMDPRVTEICLLQIQIFSPMREFFFISYDGNSGNPPKMDEFCWTLEIHYSAIQLYSPFSKILFVGSDGPQICACRQSKKSAALLAQACQSRTQASQCLCTFKDDL